MGVHDNALGGVREVVWFGTPSPVRSIVALHAPQHVATGLGPPANHVNATS
ncbi:hypothetical protein DPMN_114100 [Dreissena polymorpha]|uniref:Uncharacterized protein n=1 Tax=Dreissena polymorpha TaxID=45954 RepID=A0A9D4QS53_DREPO|nr:hypothetical protein DPMN_114100 [Dreissena polymorpha]